jgi:hypothetical protein
VVGKLKLSSDDGRVIQLPFEAFEKNEGRWAINAPHK